MNYQMIEYAVRRYIDKKGYLKDKRNIICTSNQVDIFRVIIMRLL